MAHGGRKGPERHELVNAVGQKERRHEHAAHEQGQIVGSAEHDGQRGWARSGPLQAVLRAMSSGIKG
jgi:hypothetical protein